ncbi:hypothetical protein [Streptosporangium sp. 'caverna']|uniref:hypothetical protein n=1 Tax=Streptosporangium sp. 'caverna' TaxID=2202249 RepID=UPI000D7DEBE0|nr:hypothetical protein [Streptosporangium sp. 'caverna']AWS40944.1 hypothetical protein DKM19_05810 [Streptosporangium sp. 'caverna']
MKKRHLERRMSRLAKKYGLEITIKHGGNHDEWYVGGDAVPIPRHSEIKENTAKGILRTWEEMVAEAKEQEGEDE